MSSQPGANEGEYFVEPNIGACELRADNTLEAFEDEVKAAKAKKEAGARRSGRSSLTGSAK